MAKCISLTVVDNDTTYAIEKVSGEFECEFRIGDDYVTDWGHYDCEVEVERDNGHISGVWMWNEHVEFEGQCDWCLTYEEQQALINKIKSDHYPRKN